MDKVSLPRFKKIIEEIRAKFLDISDKEVLTQGKVNRLPTAVVQKCKSLVSALFRQFGYEVCRIRPENCQWRIKDISKREKKQGLRLYVGCGEETKEGYVGCDIRPLPNVSIVCQAWEVSQHCSEVKEIYSRHMLEHLTLQQIEATLRDWMQALAIDGVVYIAVPNMDFHIEQWRRAVWNKETWSQKWSDARHAFAGFWGWQRGSDLENSEDKNAAIYWDIHKSGFNKEFLSFLLNRAGFRVIKCEIVNKIHIVAHAVKKDEVSKE